jgi:hypothetical protein
VPHLHVIVCDEHAQTATQLGVNHEHGSLQHSCHA